MRNRWNDFKCLYMANLEEDQTHEVGYTYSSQRKDPAAPNFSVTISIDDLGCHIPSDVREANPEAFKLFEGSTATLCIASYGAEFAPQGEEDHVFQLNPKTKTGFVVIRAPSVELASSMATQMLTHKQIGVFIEFAANEKDFGAFVQSQLINIPIWSISITFYASGEPLQ